MLQAVLENLNNWFVKSKSKGSFVVKNQSIDIPKMLNGQYFRIVGSVFNDGLHQYPATDLTDETFIGEVWFLAIPRAVIDLSDEIKAWTLENKPTDYTSESFGGYSYSKAKNKNGEVLGWQDIYRRRLNHWRKIC